MRLTGCMCAMAGDLDINDPSARPQTGIHRNIFYFCGIFGFLCIFEFSVESLGPKRRLKSFLVVVVPCCLNMRPNRATGIRFMSETMVLGCLLQLQCVEKPDMCFVGSRDICLVESQDMCLGPENF